MRMVLGAIGLFAALLLVSCSEVSSPTSQRAATRRPAPGGPQPGKVSPPGDGRQPATVAAPDAPGVLSPGNTKITFVGTKKDGRHDGGFKTFSGSIVPIQGELTASKITLDIDTQSLWADNPKLTNHLKSPDFFEVKKYPKATFNSTKIEKKDQGDTTHLISGDLTLHGTTKAITVPAKVTATDNLLSIDSQFTLDRTEYGIAFSPDRVDKVVTVKVSAKVPRK
jgi:polyisoprenoid-binding protein YceI